MRRHFLLPTEKYHDCTLVPTWILTCLLSGLSAVTRSPEGRSPGARSFSNTFSCRSVSSVCSTGKKPPHISFRMEQGLSAYTAAIQLLFEHFSQLLHKAAMKSETAVHHLLLKQRCSYVAFSRSGPSDQIPLPWPWTLRFQCCVQQNDTSCMLSSSLKGT